MTRSFCLLVVGCTLALPYIPGLNAELGKMAERLNKRDQPVLILDQFQGFDPGKDTIADKVHPNARGAEKMAARWFEALKPVLDKTRSRDNPK